MELTDKSSFPHTVKVGIMTSDVADICFKDTYIYEGDGLPIAGHCRFNAMEFDDGDYLFTPRSSSSFFEIRNVMIGKDFHWQKRECQSFHGSLLLKAKDGMFMIINILPIEQYLESVVSSEMNPDAPIEFLKAHAVISRSWLISQICRKSTEPKCGSEDMELSEDRKIVWYDHSQHQDFDVCADDHCQRYQGIRRIVNENAVKAVADTCGEILTFNDEICDTRFSKCCGGAFETFENCWQNSPQPYLSKGPDSNNLSPESLPDLTMEDEARKWIIGNPDSFCNTSDKEILSQVLNDYDQKTNDFFRWKKEYSRNELSTIIRQKSGIDFGDIIRLVPMKRGVSARIVELKIVGTKKSMTIGKELEIRRVLSHTHLYSSAFIVDARGYDTDGIPSAFVISGAGWGHGVGLCQIGAAVMACKGYSYRQILSHYYPGSVIVKKQDAVTE